MTIYFDLMLITIPCFVMSYLCAFYRCWVFAYGGWRVLIAIAVLLGLTACVKNDIDLRDKGGGLDTTSAAQQSQENPSVRPQADARGVISYGAYQTVFARAGESVSDVAFRLAIDSKKLADYNGLTETYLLQENEVLVLPERLNALPYSSSITETNNDITAIANRALEQVGSNNPPLETTSDDNAVINVADGAPRLTPLRHRVARNETLSFIAQFYNADKNEIARWNNLTANTPLREGQILIIPITSQSPVGTANTAQENRPGVQSTPPLPPVIETINTRNNAITVTDIPASPALSQYQTNAAGTLMARPVIGEIIRDYGQGGNEGIDIAARAGEAVKAADFGEVITITRNTLNNTIVIIRHADELLTVYANVTDVSVSEGEVVAQNQRIASVAEGNPSFVHFEIRQGFKSQNPVPYIYAQ